MLKSIKSQIILGISMVIIVVLGAATYFIIDQKSKEINFDIFQNAVSFAELTHERVLNNYENNYAEQAFAHFERELADMYVLNEDILNLVIFNYSGEVLYQPSDLFFSSANNEKLERIQAVIPSVQTKQGRVVYLDKTESNSIRYTNFNGQLVDSISPVEQIQNIIYPFRDPNNPLRVFSVQYNVTYDALNKRIQSTRNNLMVIALFGILGALLVGGIISERITSPIKVLTEGATKIGSGDLKTRITVKSKNEVGHLAGTFNKMAQDLEKSTQELVQKEKLTRELELAGEIQRELLPKEIPQISNLDIAASLVSADEVGGDGYDFLKIDDDQWIFYIGDVTGHGVPAGLVSAINNALVPAFLEHYQTPKELVVNINRILKQKTRSNVFLTMLMAHWSISKSTFSYSQAGHDPVLLYQAVNKTVQEMPHGGMALGMVDDIESLVSTQQFVMQPGDVAVLYTDGIPEAWRNEQENYGMERFKQSIAKNGALPTAQQIHDALYADLKAFTGSYPQADDITLIVIKRSA